MKPNSMNASTHYQFSLHIPHEKLANAFLMFDPDLRGRGGIDPKNLVRDYPDKCRKTLDEWLAICERAGRLGGGPLLFVTWRNLIQNPGCPAYTQELGICQSLSEQAERSQRPYYGMSFLRGGKFRADSFLFSEEFPEDVLQFATGIPVLWNGEVLTIEDMAPHVSDFSHLWKFVVSSTRGSREEDLDRFARLQDVFVNHRHTSAQEASKALMEEARGSKMIEEKGELKLFDAPLGRETSYLHNAVGVDAHGSPVVVLAHGSLERIGELAREAGAVAAVVVDNGGSPQISLRRSPKDELRPLQESYYHRDRSIALAAFELTEDTLRFPVGGPVEKRGTQYFTARRDDAERVGLEYQTGIGTVLRELRFSKLDGEAAEIAAIEIGNFAMIHGAASAGVDAPAGFVRRVESKFWETHRVMPECTDPSTMRAMWMEHYCEQLYGVPLKIHHVNEKAPDMSSPEIKRTLYNQAPVRYTLGLDVGGTKIKSVVLRNGRETVGKSDKETRPENPDEYTSVFFEDQLRQVARECCASAGIKPDEIGAVGMSWAGAVMNGKAATSKTLLDMKDLLNGVILNLDIYRRVTNLESFARHALKLDPRVPMAVFNDGEVEATFEFNHGHRRGVLLCKLGATVAGGFVDEHGISNPYLTELGRAVLRTDADAPRHPNTRTKGVASALIGSHALAQACERRGIKTLRGEAISKCDVGEELGAIITNGRAQAEAALDVIREMSECLSHLLIECVHHLGGVQHILLRGGLAGNHVVGDAIRRFLGENVPDIFEKIVVEKPDQNSGAYAAAWLAARRAE
jgi:hypothetical protein